MSATQYKYKVKDKRIRIFEEQNVGDKCLKCYIHPKGSYLNAYVRQLSAQEMATLNALQDLSSIEFVINARKVYQSYLIEFKDKVYKIGSPDNLEFYDTEIKIRAQEVNARTYDDITWKEWNT